MTSARFPSLSDRGVVVTGGASGIGAAIVRAFVAQGARVGVLDMDAGAGAALVDSLGGQAHFAQCDLRDIAALRAAMDRLRAALGPITVLVNNAARDDRHAVAEVEPDYWDERMATNLRHQFFATQAVVPDMVAAGGGAVVNLGSGSVQEATPNLSVYVTAKAGVEGLTRALARDLGAHSIRVNCVVPGWVETERQRDLWMTDEAAEQRKRQQMLPRLIQPEHIAAMVLFLASDDAEMCTGGSYPVTGGSP